MKIWEILRSKGHEVVTIPPEATIRAAIRMLVEHGIGSLVVMERGRVRGIVTEREVLRLINRDPASSSETRVTSVLAGDVVVAGPDDDVQHLMEVMTRKRVRHLPIVEDGVLLGIISIGDVVNHLRRDVEAENRHLREYVHGLLR